MPPVRAAAAAVLAAALTPGPARATSLAAADTGLAGGAPPTGAVGTQVSLGLGYPQTATLGLGYRAELGPAGLSATIEYQPPVDQTFLDSSLDLALRAYFAPVDATSLFKANGQFFVSVAGGRYQFAQTQTATAASSNGNDSGTFTRKAKATGSFVAPAVGFQLYDGKGHQLETELGWFRPLGLRTADGTSCQGAASLCDQAAPGLPEVQVPVYLRTSGWHVTLIRYVWTLF